MRRAIASLLLPAALLGGCGGGQDVSEGSTPEQDVDPYRLTIRSSQGSTEAVRASLCGEPSSSLIVLPCGVSLGFARASAARLYVWRERDRIALELERPARAVWISYATASGEDGLARDQALVRLRGSGRRFDFGGSTRTAGWPTVDEPRWLSVLVSYEDDLPAPRPLPSGAPEDATVAAPSAEYLVQLATRPRSAAT